MRWDADEEKEIIQEFNRMGVHIEIGEYAVETKGGQSHDEQHEEVDGIGEVDALDNLVLGPCTAQNSKPYQADYRNGKQNKPCSETST